MSLRTELKHQKLFVAADVEVNKRGDERLGPLNRQKLLRPPDGFRNEMVDQACDSHPIVRCVRSGSLSLAIDDRGRAFIKRNTTSNAHFPGSAANRLDHLKFVGINHLDLGLAAHEGRDADVR